MDLKKETVKSADNFNEKVSMDNVLESVYSADSVIVESKALCRQTGAIRDAVL
jgi:hypothetical protein